MADRALVRGGAGGGARDIAPVMGIGTNAVSALLIRARAGLRAAYQKQTMPGPDDAGGK